MIMKRSRLRAAAASCTAMVAFSEAFCRAFACRPTLSGHRDVGLPRTTNPAAGKLRGPFIEDVTEFTLTKIPKVTVSHLAPP